MVELSLWRHTEASEAPGYIQQGLHSLPKLAFTTIPSAIGPLSWSGFVQRPCGGEGGEGKKNLISNSESAFTRYISDLRQDAQMDRFSFFPTVKWE